MFNQVRNIFLMFLKCFLKYFLKSKVRNYYNVDLKYIKILITINKVEYIDIDIENMYGKVEIFI